MARAAEYRVVANTELLHRFFDRMAGEECLPWHQKSRSENIGLPLRIIKRLILCGKCPVRRQSAVKNEMTKLVSCRHPWASIPTLKAQVNAIFQLDYGPLSIRETLKLPHNTIFLDVKLIPIDNVV